MPLRATMAVSTSVFALTAAASLAGGPTTVTYDTPTLDRWMYPFNSTPGTQEECTTFGAVGAMPDTFFDDRDAQIMLGFETMADIAPDLPRRQYAITSATVTMMTSVGGYPHDSTYDSITTLTGGTDADAGRPLSMVGVGYRNGADQDSFGEFSPFPFGAGEGMRSAYAATYTGGTELTDISNNVKQGFEVTPWAIGTAPVSEGDPMPVDTTVTFDLDLGNPEVECYLKTALKSGEVRVIVSGLHAAVQPALAGTDPQPEFYMKESLAVTLGLADAPGLELTVEIGDAIDINDVNNSGAVNFDDLIGVVNAFGPCLCCPEDVNDSGEVNIDDLLSVINGF